jgi:hypothetical protein
MIRAVEGEPRTLEEWAASPWRPCCGTCRRPMLVRSVYIESAASRALAGVLVAEGASVVAALTDAAPLTCSNCGDAWDGSEASRKEAGYRLSQAAEKT